MIEEILIVIEEIEMMIVLQEEVAVMKITEKEEGCHEDEGEGERARRHLGS